MDLFLIVHTFPYSTMTIAPQYSRAVLAFPLYLFILLYPFLLLYKFLISSQPENAETTASVNLGDLYKVNVLCRIEMVNGV